MKIVSNVSPLINLARIGKLGILRELYGERQAFLTQYLDRHTSEPVHRLPQYDLAGLRGPVAPRRKTGTWPADGTWVKCLFAAISIINRK